MTIGELQPLEHRRVGKRGQAGFEPHGGRVGVGDDFVVASGGPGLRPSASDAAQIGGRDQAEIPRLADSGTQRTTAPEAASPPTAGEASAPLPAPRTPASPGALTEACARRDCAEVSFIGADAPWVALAPTTLDPPTHSDAFDHPHVASRRASPEPAWTQADASTEGGVGGRIGWSGLRRARARQAGKGQDPAGIDQIGIAKAHPASHDPVRVGGPNLGPRSLVAVEAQGDGGEAVPADNRVVRSFGRVG